MRVRVRVRMRVCACGCVFLCLQLTRDGGQTPTLIAGVMLDLTAILYLIAALRREKRLTTEELAAADENLWQKM